MLTSAAPELVRVYPPKGEAEGAELRQTLKNALVTHADAILHFIERPPQTNEVARSAALAGGFFTIAARTSLPLAIFEIGASAGLNLHWDKFSYDLGGLTVNSANERLLLAPEWQGPKPPAADVTVSERAGCDRTPIDLSSDDEILRLRTYIWPDQPNRMERLDQALAVARSTPITIERADAADWASSRLSKRREGAATVLFHSIVWQYIPEDRQKRLLALIEDAAERADKAAPFAWLRMEPGTWQAATLHLTLWPGGDVLHLADVDYHGRWVRWLVEPDSLQKL